MKPYAVGRTLATTPEWPEGVPCILVDGDSVFATFPNVPNGVRQAEEVCKVLNRPWAWQDIEPF